ncbi:hypothetical protein CENSYa_1483 [Cenarchaeum symbiosum A]|uniref:Uncharacterized protein n=1 Tax=Cenarchaeum symbiosum (strain A) TaxID=414004 RepID=A0RXN8_CENSY|nr:hypothetical protein CENSYa_1483 [Cenarchaeum symbiosum A]
MAVRPALYAWGLRGASPCMYPLGRLGWHPTEACLRTGPLLVSRLAGSRTHRAHAQACMTF